MHKKGFTLIEIMVASSIFIILMVITVGSILSMVDANRKAQALNSVISNLNIALESMIRDVRTGSRYQVTSSGGNQTIQFINTNGDRVTYWVSGTAIQKQVLQIAGPGGVSGLITAPEVSIESMNISSSGLSITDNEQPVLLLQIAGTAGGSKSLSTFTVQTMISQRLLDS